ncbi:LCP family protein [Defluviitalea saccharophila]|uniref:LCP family protein n=1 Tax=Defluviitalea saccharophila TaxID=879970 RepID=A0ABZ2Y3P4_9FIRM|nr:LCP family protein [Candidatus Epulonipiscium sp.]
MAEKKKKEKGKHYLVRRFFSIVFLMVFSFIVLAGIGTYGYLHFSKAKNSDDMTPSQKSQGKKSVLDLFKKTPKKIRTNVAIFGVDKDQTRTDVIIVATFNSETKKVNLVSVPRDTRVFLTESMLADMRSRISGVPDTVKINEVHAYAGKEKANEYSVKEVERLLGIDIDYYVKVNIEAFRKIVDQIGGVEITLDRDYYYVDRAGGLFINLKAGPQTLNGEQAEQLVRFRKDNRGGGYGDLGRIETQQKFLKAFAKKMLSPQNILNAPSIIKILFDYVETDVDLNSALQYVQYLDDIDVNNIEMSTIPGEARMVGGKSYFIHDEQGTKELIDKIFFTEEADEESTVENSKDARIEVLNGGSVSGLAQATSDKLKADGYNVVKIGNYEGTKEQSTRIFVRKKGWGEDLKAYFENSTVIVDDSELSDNVDIQIVLGLDEK